MLKLRKRLLIGLLTAAIVLSTGQTLVFSDTDDSTPADGEAAPVTGDGDGASDGDTGSTDDEDTVVLVTEEEALAEMVKYTENSNFALYINESMGQFAVQNKASGYVWFSSPINADNDTIAKGAQKKTMKSLFWFNVVDPISVENSTKVTSFDGCVTKGGLSCEKIENGCKFTFFFSKQAITIPVYITLEDDGLQVNIPINEVIEEKANQTEAGGSKIVDLTLLESFGATTADQDGYIVVPDGSGAVINFNNQKTNTSSYSALVYGRDLAISALTKSAKTETVNLPLYGMVIDGADGDNAILGVLTSGDECAKINAGVVAQNTTSYNTANFSFILRTSDTYFMGSANKRLSVVEQGKIKTGDLTAKYFLMSGDDLTYVDLAKKYQDYLIKEENVTAKTTANTSPYYLTLYGGTVKTQSVLGFPVDMQTVATTYSQAVEIMTMLQDKGVDNINLVYNDFSNAGIEGYVNTGLDYSSALGGKSEFDKLNTYMTSNSFGFYPSVDFMEFRCSGNGYSFSLNSSKQITKAIASQVPYDLAYGIPHDTKAAWTILSPYYWTDIFTKVVKSYKSGNVSGISLSQATNTLYSDFSRTSADGSDYISRADAVATLEAGMALMKTNGMKILAQGCNAYALPYADEIVNVPMYSSNFDVFDYDIPFYQLVIHGIIPYTTKPINENADDDQLLLLSLSTGTPIHYDMMYSSPNKLTDSDYDTLYYTYYEGWIDSSAAQYTAFKDAISSVSDKQIISHKYLTSTKIETVFEGGTKIVVDLADNTVEINGTKIDYNNGLKGEATNE